MKLKKSTKITKLSTQLKNVFRGGASHRHARHNIYRALLSTNEDVNTALSPFLLESAYKIRPNQWIALSYSDQDWVEIGKLASSKNLTLQKNVVNLLEQHIVQNVASVKRLEAVSSSFSVLLLNDPEQDTGDALSAVSGIDRQSLFFWKLLAGGYSQRGSDLVRHLRNEFKTNWLTHRFLYPFAFHAINVCPEHLIPQTLDYVVSGQEKPWEMRILEYAVGYRKRLTGNEIPFFWAALQMHPYDAIELISDCLDGCFASGTRMPDEFDSCFEIIGDATKNKRFQYSLARYHGSSHKMTSELSKSDISLPLSDKNKEFLLECVSDLGPKGSDPNSPFLRSLVAIRRDKYPLLSDYEAVVYSARIWKFLEAGRFLHGYAASLFLFPRTSWECASSEFLGPDAA